MKGNNHKKHFSIDEFARKFYCSHARLNQLPSDKHNSRRKIRRDYKKETENG